MIIKNLNYLFFNLNQVVLEFCIRDLAGKLKILVFVLISIFLLDVFLSDPLYLYQFTMLPSSHFSYPIVSPTSNHNYWSVLV